MSNFLRLCLLTPLLAFPISLPSCSFQKNDGGLYKTKDAGQNWEQISKIEEESKKNLSSANTLSFLDDPNNPEVVFWIVKGTGLFVSNNFGDSWKRLAPETSAVYSIAPEKSQKGTFYLSAILGERGKILKTENGGIDWREIYTEAGSDTYITEIESHPLIPNFILAVNSAGFLTGSKDGGLTWQAVFSFSEKVKKIIIDQEQSGVVWALTEHGLWKSEKNGLDFQKLEAGAFDQWDKFGQKFYLLEKNAAGIFLSTEKGLFRSKDGGVGWERVSTLNDSTKYPILALSFLADGQRNFWVMASGMALYITFDEGKKWKPIQFEIGRSLNAVLIKKGDPNQMLIGVTELPKELLNLSL